MTGTPFKITFRDEAYGELRGVESAFRVHGETPRTLTTAIKSAGYRWHDRRGCWYSYESASRLILEDNIAVLGARIAD